jgi:ABC-type glycerol-3-phosphate transport system substrate-binding protein
LGKVAIARHEAAVIDEFTMTETTRPATWSDLLQLARQLNEAGARYALIGGYALAAHGYNRFSEDLDILVDPGAENTPRWLAALSMLPDGAATELKGEDNLFGPDSNYAIRINDEFHAFGVWPPLG